MNLTRCLVLTVLLLAVVVAAVLVTLFVTKKSKDKGESAESAPSEAPPAESPELVRKLEQKVDEARALRQEYEDSQDQLRMSIFQEQELARQELDRKHREALQKLREQFKPETSQLVDLSSFVTPDLVLDFGAVLPTRVGSYTSGNETIKVTREPYPPRGTVKFTHQRMNGFFNLNTVKNGPQTFNVDPPRKDVVLVTTYSLEADPSYPYYMLIGSKGIDPDIYEMVGDKFVLSPDTTTFFEPMVQKAKQLGRPYDEEPSTPRPPQRREPDVEESYEEEEARALRKRPEARPEAPAGPKAVFQLDFNASFILGSEELKLTVSSEYDNKYNAYFYSIKQKTMRPDSFTVNDVEQKGLPVGNLFNGIVVYFAVGAEKNPLMVKFLYLGDDSFYINSLNNTWTEVGSGSLEERLDFLDSVLNNRIVLNVSRRSDYYRNGTGDSHFESSKDVNVYVDTDSPCSGWSTYRHTLEEGGEGGVARNFYVSRMVSGNYKFVFCPKKEVAYVDAYAKSDSDIGTPPLGLLIKYADGTHEYCLRYGTEFIDKSVSNIDVNETNLVDKLKGIGAPIQYKPQAPERHGPPPPVTEVEVVLSRTTSFDYFTNIVKADPKEFPLLTFPDYTTYVHRFNENVRVSNYRFKNTPQTGLPTDEVLAGVLVYFSDKTFEWTPTVLCTIPPYKDMNFKCYLKNGTSSWFLFVDLEALDVNSPSFKEDALKLINKHYNIDQPKSN